MIASLLLVVAMWASEPPGQQYAVSHGSRVIFWVEEERSPTYGTVCYLWGYYPVIVADGGGMFEFNAVSWCVGWL
jgi:hypothetical protein